MEPLVFVVSHTHWDREWYRPFEAFRLRLGQLVSDLCDLLDRDPGYRHFLLDGQTICLEDVIALAPELEPRLRAHVAAGRLSVGPWYVLQDEFLVSGESIVRNLLEGRRTAARFGRPLGVGYLPDAFGHVAQMPRILRGFGIEAAVLWRGVGDRAPGSEWRWRAPGGAEVLCLYLPGGYGNAAHLPTAADAAQGRLRRDLGRLRSPAGVLLWMNGVDHAWPQPHLPALLDALRQANPGLTIVHAGLEEAVGAVRARLGGAELPVVEGELRRPGGDAPVLPGVLSVRSWQKRAHDRALAHLGRRAEAFAALAGLEGRPALRHAWRLLLACQPHDSICGCSIDAVHREVAGRLRRVRQVAREVYHAAVRGLAGGDGGDDLDLHGGVALGSSQPFFATALAYAVVQRPRPEDPFRLLGPSGEVPYDVVSEWASERGTEPTRFARLRILARETAPHGLTVLRIEPGPPTARAEGLVAAPEGISNGIVRVRPIPGGVEIVDLPSGQCLLHTFCDVADRGDEYNFCALEGDTPRSSAELALAAEVALGRAAAQLRLRGGWTLPRALSADRRRRRGTGRLGLALRATLVERERRVEIDLVLDHRIRDHRLRARFDLGAAAPEMVTDTPFGWIERPAGAPPPAAGVEDVVATCPVSTLSVVATAKARVAVGGLGLHEVELTPEGALLLTIVRAVGWMSRSDLASRRGHAGYQLRTPGAQGQGRLRFRYAIGFGERAAPAAALWRTLEPALVPPVGVALARAVPATRPLLAIEPPEVRLCAVKRAEADDRLLVRLVGPEAGTALARVRFFRPLARAWLSDLDERAGTPLALSGPPESPTVALPLPAGEVATIAVEPA